MRALRSKWVGPSSPTSTPRWTSRSCGGSCTCLRHERRGPLRRWRAADRDLRDARGDLAQRDRLRREAHECASCVRPAPKRRPLRAPRDTRRHADPLANARGPHRHDSPQRHRHRDRRETVVPAWRDTTRHDQNDRATRVDDAAISTTRNPRPVRICVSVRRAEDCAVPFPVTVKAKTSTGRPTRGATSRTPPWARSLR
jgi:hypothetical protein